MYSDITETINQIDSMEFCNYAIANLNFTEECRTIAGGFLNIGLENMMAAFLNEIQYIKLAFI